MIRDLPLWSLIALWAFFGYLFLFTTPSMSDEGAAGVEEDIPQKTFAELAADKSQISKEKREVRSILRRKDVPLDEEKIEILENFLRRYYFARMTDVSEIAELPARRIGIRDMCNSTAGKSEAMEQVNQKTSSMMHALCNGVLDAKGNAGTQQVIILQESVRDQDDQLRVVRSMDELKSGDRIFNLAGDPVARQDVAELAPASEDFHPAVKLNAMLVLGDLNDKQPRRGKPNTAEPRKLTQKDLVAYLESHEALSDVLLVGALAGMRRQANWEQDPSRKKRIANVVVSLVDLPESSKRNKNAVDWIRRQAIDILGTLGLPGERSRYVAKLYKIIRDDKAPLPLRVAATEALRKMDLSSLPKGKVAQLTQSLNQLAVDVCESEILDQLRQNQDFSATRLRVRLAAVRLAVIGDLQAEASEDESPGGGLMAVAADQEEQALQSLLVEIQKIETRVSTLAETTPRKEIESLLKESIQELKDLQLSEEKQQPEAPQTAEN